MSGIAKYAKNLKEIKPCVALKTFFVELNAFMMSRPSVCNVTFRFVTNAGHYPCTTKRFQKIYAYDIFIGYVHEFIVQQRVTWLEATIAGPVCSSLVTY